MDSNDLTAIWLTLKLATVVTLVLLALGTPIAWWLARTSSRLRHLILATVSLPLVLPPTVLGFYLLLAMGPQGPLGKLSQPLGIELAPFTFGGLVFASVIYSLPFMVQPLHTAFESLGPRPLEVAATLRASPWQTFWRVVLPLCRRGFLSGAVLTFAHTIGEFGVVLMIGGSIPGATRVLSVQLYDHVEALDYGRAHLLAGGLLAFSFLSLLLLHVLTRPARARTSS